jgi:hypothetical protein
MKNKTIILLQDKTTDTLFNGEIIQLTKELNPKNLQENEEIGACQFVSELSIEDELNLENNEIRQQEIIESKKDGYFKLTNTLENKIGDSIAFWLDKIFFKNWENFPIEPTPIRRFIS